MCCDHKCLFFIKVRTGSLIFGYIGAILSGIGLLACFGSILYYLAMFIIIPVDVSTQNMYLCMGFNFVATLFVEFTIGFICNVLLLFGIAQNTPVLVKTYIIYGMIHLGVLLCVVIILFCTCLIIFGVLALLGCGIYTLVIYMAYLTYKGMTNTEGNVLNDPPKLSLP